MTELNRPGHSDMASLKNAYRAAMEDLFEQYCANYFSWISANCRTIEQPIHPRQSLDIVSSAIRLCALTVAQAKPQTVRSCAREPKSEPQAAPAIEVEDGDSEEEDAVWVEPHPMSQDDNHPPSSEKKPPPVQRQWRLKRPSASDHEHDYKDNQVERDLLEEFNQKAHDDEMDQDSVESPTKDPETKGTWKDWGWSCRLLFIYRP